MIDATVKQDDPDIPEATRKISQAVKHRTSADGCVDNESAFILLYAAVHKALSAVLLSLGLRVDSGERAHVVLIVEAKKHVGNEHAALLSRLDRARRKRNSVAYETEQIADDELATMKTDTKTTLEVALRFVNERKRELEQSPATD
jgi:hypothetical protein